MQPLIVAEQLTKKYSRRPKSGRRHALHDLISAWLGRTPPTQSLRKDEFFAAKDVSFEVHRGESIALIGRNGSGKTTILKMLAGLTKPDGGRAVLRGRVQSLINLGTGFNNSLTGKENVHNGAAVCGLSRKQSQELIDEVVHFAELGEFIDSNYGTYSSGMKARLGFALAVHLLPDILLIDEILGVGDFAFQNKCFAKMNSLQRKGATIVLVSHSHNRIVQMCERACWLHDGTVMDSGPSAEVVTRYLAFLEEQQQDKTTNGNTILLHEPGKKSPKVNQRVIANAEHYGGRLEQHSIVGRVRGTLTNAAGADLPLWVHCRAILTIEFTLTEEVDRLNMNLPVYRARDGLHITKLSTQHTKLLEDVHSGNPTVEFTIEDLNLTNDDYVLVAAIFSGHEFLYRELLLEFTVCSGGQLYFPNNLLDLKCEQRIIAHTNSSDHER